MQVLQRDFVEGRRGAVALDRGAVGCSAAKNESGVVRVDVFRGAKKVDCVDGTPLGDRVWLFGGAESGRVREGIINFA